MGNSPPYHRGEEGLFSNTVCATGEARIHDGPLHLMERNSTEAGFIQ